MIITNEVKTGDYISIKDIDSIIKKYLSSCLFSGIDLKYLKNLCITENDVFYKIFDICKTCDLIYIKIKDHKSIVIKFKDIKEIKPTKL